jgi:NADH oxidase (H2O2-forming)
MKILIIGGGAAGGTAAQFARKTDRKAEICIIDSEPYGQYSRCGLPYAMRGMIDDGSLVEYSPEWFEKNRIDALYGWKASSVDFSSKKVTVERDGESKEMEYDRLIIATGARPWAPPVKGMESEGVFFLRTMDDLSGIKEYAENIGKALVVGAGLIGLESAESLIEMGKEVTVVEFLPGPLLAMFDIDMSSIVAKALESSGIRGLYNHQVLEIRGNPVSSVIAEDRETGKRKEMETDMVIVATGNVPYTEIFDGIEKGPKGHIRVNERSETSITDVYAAGDCTEYIDAVTGQYVPMGMGTMAVRQGMAAGVNAAGGEMRAQHYLGTRTTELFGVKMAAVGPTEHNLKDSGMETVSARYYSNFSPPFITITF